MEVVRLRVEAFKSLYELDANLEHLSVITGPNGSGKSNFVDAFTFLADVYRYGLEFAVSRAGGYENIAHRRSRRAKRPIAFQVEVAATGADLWKYARLYVRAQKPTAALQKKAKYRLRHGFSFRASSQRLIEDFAVVSENFSIHTEEGLLLAQFDFKEKSFNAFVSPAGQDILPELRLIFSPFLDDDFAWESWASSDSATELLASSWRYGNSLTAMTQMLSKISVYQLSPQVSRQSGVTTPNATLGRFGDNLPGAATALKRSNPTAWQAVQAAMRAILPNLLSVEVAATEDRRLALQFRESDVRRPWNSNEVSDGTIQTLALLVALFDPRSSMLIIEEPENAVHPWILRKVVDLAREANRQVVFTTHSPVLLDYVNPASIYLMWSDQGRSSLRKFSELDPDLTRDIVEGTISPFTLYDSGFFPKAVPRGMSPEQEIDT